MKSQPPVNAQINSKSVTAIDEFKGDAGKGKFQIILADAENKEIIEILPDRRAETWETYFGSCDIRNVQISVIDMYRAFKRAIESF